jgi:CRISPR-associated protein Csm3
MTMKLSKIERLEGTIKLKSGLHIGSGNTEMHIGGTDSPVIKHSHTLEPYIPGSSLKGKIRSLLEMESGLVPFAVDDGGLVSCKTLEQVKNNPVLANKAKAILKIFGSSGADKVDETPLGPTRVSFADCYLEDAWRQKAKDNRWLLTEEKSENSIDRIRGTAENPRFIERVPEGAEFHFLVSFKIFQEDDNELFNFLLRGLKLLEMDALGGSGSRGYGRIAFSFSDKEINASFRGLNPFV